MIPFSVPVDGEIVNLSQIVRVEQFLNDSPPYMDVTFSDGTTVRYQDQAANILKSEIAFALKLYREYQLQIISPIITTDPTAGRLM